MFEPEKVTKYRCEGCEYRRTVYAQNGFTFYGCYHHPYSGKRVEEIKDCPKSKKLSEECCYTCYHNRNRLDRNYNCNCEFAENRTQDGWCSEYEGEE